jgi:hypothetical protein
MKGQPMTEPKGGGLRGRDKQQGSVQGEPVPTEGYELPEGLKRRPKGPYDKDLGRGNK